MPHLWNPHVNQNILLFIPGNYWETPAGLCQIWGNSKLGWSSPLPSALSGGVSLWRWARRELAGHHQCSAVRACVITVQIWQISPDQICLYWVNFHHRLSRYIIQIWRFASKYFISFFQLDMCWFDMCWFGVFVFFLSELLLFRKLLCSSYHALFRTW